MWGLFRSVEGIIGGFLCASACVCVCVFAAQCTCSGDVVMVVIWTLIMSPLSFFFDETYVLFLRATNLVETDNDSAIIRSSSSLQPPVMLLPWCLHYLKTSFLL